MSLPSRDFEVFGNLFGNDASRPEAKFGLFDAAWKDSFPYYLPNNGTLFDNTTQCALHLSSGRCNSLGPANIDKVVRHFHLAAYAKHSWCPTQNRRNMKKYGIDWPFCWDPPI